jgi:serine/threonine protein kinase
MIGRVIKGKYKIYDEVGSGGFATVYLGRNLETNEIVAIKVLNEQYTREPRYLERFRREAGLAERLRHPSIVRVFDHGIENGLHFLVMQFVEGLTLDKVLERRGSLPIGEVLSYVKQVCAGLQAPYEAGIIHRDIKPANLMITPDGRVKIMDFGIARVESMSTLTQSGMFMGTPRYLSPEMAIGVGADIRSDLYALGLLTYEMLSGSPPFDADNPWAVLRLQVEAQPEPLRQVRPEVPSWLEAIIVRAIAKDPAQRFQTPADMLAALEKQTPTPEKVRAVTPVARRDDVTVLSTPQPERKRHKGLVLGLVAAAVVVALGLVALLTVVFGGGKATPTATAIVVVVTNTPGETPLPTETSLPPTEMSLPPTATPSPEPTATELLPPTDSPQPTPTLTASLTDTAQPSPTPTHVPTNTPQPTAVPTRAPTNTPQPTDTATVPPAPAATGRIAFSVGGTLYVVDVQTMATLYTVSGMRQPDFRRDGAELLADGLGDPATVVRINANTGGTIREQTEHTDDFHPSWAPDGVRFAYDSLHHGLGNYTMLYTQGITDRKPQPEVTLFFNGQQIRGHSPVWMDDDQIAFTGCDYWPEGSGGSKCGIYIIPSWSGRPTLIHPGSTDMRATDNYGSQLLLMSQETGNWEVFVMPNRGGAARNLSESPASQDGLGTFSPDGKKVAFVSNRGGTWAIWVVNANGGAVARLLSLPGKPTSDPWVQDSISWGP